MNRHCSRALFVLIGGLLGACDGPVDLGAVRDAPAQCEAPTPEQLNATARMLPGRMCQACHLPGGQAGYLSWTASGTVYGRPDSACNEGGLEGVQVDLLDERDQIFLSLTTNRSGNFFTSESIDVPRFRIRLSKDGKCQEMIGLQPTGACAGCHYPSTSTNAPGRVYLDDTPCK